MRPDTREGMTEDMPSPASLPSSELLELQAQWLAPARTQLLRRVHIARRRRILDLGTGAGSVLSELVHRSSRSAATIGLDHSLGALTGIRVSGALRVAGDGVRLPLVDETLDLVYSQMTLLWIRPLNAVVSEIWRVLEPGGTLVALEPDYGGLMEYPESLETRELWLTALERAGADPCVGRKLPSILEQTGFDVLVSLFDSPHAPESARFRFLEDLPMTESERDRFHQAASAAQRMDQRAVWSQVAHLPFFLIRATKPADGA